MSAIDHPDYSEELNYLNYTVDYMKNYCSEVSERKKHLDKKVAYGLKYHNMENTEQFNDLTINSLILNSMTKKLDSLEKTLSKPYFARVDFTEDDSHKYEKLYVGKASLIRKEDNEFIIVDWRAPVSNLYYEGRLGEASYDCPDGNIKGNISLKRQYSIENGELKEIYDVDITTNDDFLQACLNSNKDNRLKDIVSTIQSEQNRVIRADLFSPLIVQGAAGGGKTTIALHRIAYLLYNYEKTYRAENFMIIAPSKFFLSYISDVLPELGVENVKQTTFEDFAFQVIGKKYKLKDTYEKILILLDDKKDDKKAPAYSKEDIAQISSFKSSSLFKDIIEKYIKNIEKNFIPKEDFVIRGRTLYTYDEIQKLFMEDYNYLPFVKRLNEIKKNFNTRLFKIKDDLLYEIEREYDKRILHVKATMDDGEERRKLLINIMAKRDAVLNKYRNSIKTISDEYVERVEKLMPHEYYSKFIENEDLFLDICRNLCDEEMAFKARQYTLDYMKDNLLELEDLSPMMLIKCYVYGTDPKLKVRHIVIDEAQDFSIFQFYVLKKILNNESLSILGDLCQGIHSYRGIHSWNEVASQVFGNKNVNFLTLEQSYRTTIEIMEAASMVIKFLNDPSLPPVKPVIRHGNPVEISEKECYKEIAENIKGIIGNMDKEGFKSAAIICKTMKECHELKKHLDALKIHVKLITAKDREYSGGAVLVPSYLVKGLEFDEVIIANASKDVFTEDSLDVKLLYVCMTRPLHKLYIFSVGEKAEMLKSI